MTVFRSALQGGVLLLCAAMPASAQSGKSQAPAAPAASTAAPVSTDPESTAATYGDWVLRCQKTTDTLRLCEVAQILQLRDQDKTVPVAQIAFGRSKAGDPLKLTVALPVNVTLPGGPTLGLGDKDPHPIELAWRRCLPGTCLADAQPAPEALKGLATATAPGRLVFTDAAGRLVALPLSFRGLQQALDALGKT